MSGASEGHALVTKDDVDSSTAGSDDRVLRTAFAENGSSSFTVGSVANVAGKSYYVSKVTI